MKPYLIIGVCVLSLLVVISLIWFDSRRLASSSISSPLPKAVPQAVSITNDLVTPPIHKLKSHYPLTREEQAMMDWRVQKNARDPFSDWKTSINFYGLVIDENNKPLLDAKVSWITTNMEGNGHGSTTSGYDGRFFIETTGKAIDVIVRKEGYRTVERETGFEFADFTRDNYYDYNKDNPAIFHLRKIPPYEPIYIRTGAVRDNLAGNKITIDPVTGRVMQGESPQGMWIQFVPGPQKSAGREQYDIVIGTASGGGIIFAAEDADENAPESGYQTPLDSHLMIDFQGERIFKHKLFFKDQKGHYGMLNFDIELLAHNLNLFYTLKYNPNGGTSLSAPRHSEFQINKTPY